MNKWILIVALVSQVAIADEVSDLSNATDQITTDAAGVTTLEAKYRMTNAGRCALLVMGTSATSSAPISFVPGPTPIALLQADVIVGPGITITGITAGPEAVAAGKGIQFAPISGGARFILFGVNQNVLGPGNVANVSFDLTGASAGSHILALTNFVASDANANEVPLCVTTGVITK